MPASRRALTATQVAAIKDDGVNWVAPSLVPASPRAGHAQLAVPLQPQRREPVDGSRLGGRQAASPKPGTKPRCCGSWSSAAATRWPRSARSRPSARSSEKPKAPTFDECAKQYIAAHESGWKNDKHIAQWKSTLEIYCGPVIGKKRVDEITIEDVLKVLKPIWTSKPETASRLRGRIEKVLGWATAMKYRTGENPAALDRRAAAPAAGDLIGPEGRAPQGRPLQGRAQADGRAAQERQHQRQGSDVHDPHRVPHQRGARRHLGRVRLRRQGLDHPCRAHEGRPRAPRAAQRRSHRDHREPAARRSATCSTTRPVGRSATWRCCSCCAASATTASRCTALDHRSGTGRPSRPTRRARWSRPVSLMRSVMPRSSPTSAPTSSRSGAGVTCIADWAACGRRSALRQ